MILLKLLPSLCFAIVGLMLLYTDEMGLAIGMFILLGLVQIIEELEAIKLELKKRNK